MRASLARGRQDRRAFCNFVKVSRRTDSEMIHCRSIQGILPFWQRLDLRHRWLNIRPAGLRQSTRCPLGMSARATLPARDAGRVAKEPPHRKSSDSCSPLNHAQEPVSPRPALSLMSASALPTPAHFRPLGLPMFDSPTIAS
jgi:hypothetical protein